MNFATVLSDAEALPWVELACQQRDYGDPIFDEVDATGARGVFDGVAVHLIVSPFARRELNLRRFEPRAGCYAITSRHVADRRSRALLQPGEIIDSEMSREAIKAIARQLPPNTTTCTGVLQRHRRGPLRTVGYVLALKNRYVLRYPCVRAADVARGWWLINPGEEYVESVVTPAMLDPRCRQPIDTAEQALDLAEWLASSSRITAADIEALLRRAPLPRQAIAEIAVHARESFECEGEA